MTIGLNRRKVATTYSQILFDFISSRYEASMGRPILNIKYNYHSYYEPVKTIDLLRVEIGGRGASGKFKITINEEPNFSRKI